MSYPIDTPKQALTRLKQGNEYYLTARQNPADISPARRMETAHHGQHPFAAILTCADSRVPPEHIFTAGIGNLFVVRTAGNIAGDFETGSIEYAVEHLGVPLILVMGHTHCGAVAAALEEPVPLHPASPPASYTACVIREIQQGLHGNPDEAAAVYQNTQHSKRQLLCSGIIRAATHKGEVALLCARYNTATGRVTFFDC